jgi:hypothetical protein
MAVAIGTALGSLPDVELDNRTDRTKRRRFSTLLLAAQIANGR